MLGGWVVVAARREWLLVAEVPEALPVAHLRDLLPQRLPSKRLSPVREIL